MKAVVSTLIGLFVLLLGSEAFAQEGTIGIKLRRWRAEITGNVQVEDSGLTGTSIDLDSQLGFGDEEDFNEFQVYTQLPILGRITFMYWKGGFEGSELLTTSFNFAGSTFTVGSNVDTRMDFEVATLLFHIGVSTPKVAGTGFGGGGVIGVKMMNMDAQVEAPGIDEAAKFGGPMPVVGAFTRAQVAGSLFVEAQVHGLYLPNLAGIKGLLYDGTIALDYKSSQFFVGVGYRILKLNIKDESGGGVDEAEFDMEMKGLFFEIGTSF